MKQEYKLEMKREMIYMMEKILELNERFGRTNLTGFKIVTDQLPNEVVAIIKRDINDLNQIPTKKLAGMKFGDNYIDLRVRDNGTPITYIFRNDETFQEVKKEMKTWLKNEKPF